MKKISILLILILTGCLDRIDGTLIVNSVTSANILNNSCEYIIRRSGLGDEKYYVLYDNCGKYIVGDTLKLTK